MFALLPAVNYRAGIPKEIPSELKADDSETLKPIPEQHGRLGTGRQRVEPDTN